MGDAPEAWRDAGWTKALPGADIAASSVCRALIGSFQPPAVISVQLLPCPACWCWAPTSPGSTSRIFSSVLRRSQPVPGLCLVPLFLTPVSPRLSASDLAMDFQPPYFPPPFSSSAAAVPGHAHSSDAVFPAHLQPDHYQHYAVSHQPHGHK